MSIYEDGEKPAEDAPAAEGGEGGEGAEGELIVPDYAQDAEQIIEKPVIQEVKVNVAGVEMTRTNAKLLGLVVVVGIGAYIYTQQQAGPTATGSGYQSSAVPSPPPPYRAPPPPPYNSYRAPPPPPPYFAPPPPPPVACVAAPVTNGLMQVSGYGLTQSARVTCNVGFMPSSQQAMTCQVGRWMPNVYCMPAAPPPPPFNQFTPPPPPFNQFTPPPPPFGQSACVTPPPFVANGQYVVNGAQATLQCASGFHLSAGLTSVLQCTGGRWSRTTIGSAPVTCTQQSSAPVVVPQSSNGQVPSEYVQYSEFKMDTCYQLRARQLQAVMHEEQPTFGAPHTQACHNGNPIYAQTDARADTFKFVTPLSTPDGDQFGNPGDPYVISIESCQNPGRYLRHCYYEIWAGEFGTGPPYDFQWHINPGQNGAVQLRTTSHAPDESRPGMEQWRYRDMEVIPGDNHRVTMVTEGLHEDWFLIPAHRAGSSLFGNPIPPPPPFNSFPPPPPGYGAGGAGTCTCTPSGCNPQGCGNVDINALGPGARQRDLHIGVTAGAFTGGDVGDGHVDFVGDMAMCVNVMGRGGMRVGDCNFITDALAARPDQGHGRMESMTITAENEILDWEQCAEDWVEASSHRGAAGDCSALNAAHGASGSGCCHNTFGNSANDLALAEVLDSIRWSAYPADVTIQVSGLQQHTEYKLQLLFQERCCTRAFDVSICSDFSCFGQPPALEDFCPMREQGGVTAAGSGAGAGAFIAYEFTAQTPQLTITLSGKDVNEGFPDHNPIIDGVTLERSPGARLPTEALYNGATSVLLSGGDPGEGGDFSGDFAYAVNVGPGQHGGLQVGGAMFSTDMQTQGITVTAGREIEHWGDRVSFGSHGHPTQNDENLANILWSIRWSPASGWQGVHNRDETTGQMKIEENTLRVTAQLQAGMKYRLQLLFLERCCSRGFDILVDGQRVAEKFAPERDQGGISATASAAIVAYDFTARSNSVLIELDGEQTSTCGAQQIFGGNEVQDCGFPDNNPILNAFTIERCNPSCDGSSQSSITRNADGSTSGGTGFQGSSTCLFGRCVESGNHIVQGQGANAIGGHTGVGSECHCTPTGCTPAGCGAVGYSSLGARAAEVDLNPGVSTGAFTGGDVGDGHVDFEGDFQLCVDVGGMGGQTVGTCHFQSDSRSMGFTVTADHQIVDWEECAEDWVEAANHQGTAGNCAAQNAARAEAGGYELHGSGCCHNEFGSSANDVALAAVLDSIRWSGFPNEVSVQLDTLQVGTEYKMQMLFQERCCTRGFDVMVDGRMVVKDFSPMREQGGVMAQGSGAGAGAFVAYEFFCQSSQMRISLSGAQTDPGYPDHNPILSGLTLERNPGARMPQEQTYPDESPNHHATSLLLSGGDPGEGGDFSGDFVFAVNIGGSAESMPHRQVGGAMFTLDDQTPGCTVTAGEVADNWGDRLDFSTHGLQTDSDRALADVLHSIRWSPKTGWQLNSGGENYNHAVTRANTLRVQLQQNIQPNQKYRLQLLFLERCCSRGFDILVDGQKVIDKFAPERDQGGIHSTASASIVSYDFTARGNQLLIELDGEQTSTCHEEGIFSSNQVQSCGFPDNNPILNGFTLERCSPSCDGTANVVRNADGSSSGATGFQGSETCLFGRCVEAGGSGGANAFGGSTAVGSNCQCTPAGCTPPGCAAPTMLQSLGAAANEHDLVPGVSTGAFSGGDPGDGHVDFQGTFAWCVDVEGRGGEMVGDCQFVPEQSAFQVHVTAQNEIMDWQQCGDSTTCATSGQQVSVFGSTVGEGCCTNNFGGSPNDIALAQVLDSIRWSNGHAGGIDIQLSQLQMGTEYKLQLLFQERCCTRGFDVVIDGQHVVNDFSPVREQGGVATEGLGGTGHGAFIAYEFTARKTTMDILLSGSNVDDAIFPDHNPILDGMTLEMNPGARMPQESFAQGAQSRLLSGGDPGEGGDFEGCFLYAVNVGPGARTGGLQVGDAMFSTDSNTPGFTITGTEEIESWGDPIQFSAHGRPTQNDMNLAVILSSLRWSPSRVYQTAQNAADQTYQAGREHRVLVTLGNLNIMERYKLQLLFHEVCCARGFDIIVNNVKVVTNFSPERDQGGIHHAAAPPGPPPLFGQPPPPPAGTASSAAIVDYTFTAQSPSLSIELNGDDGAHTCDQNDQCVRSSQGCGFGNAGRSQIQDCGFPDTNPTLFGLTLKVLDSTSHGVQCGTSSGAAAPVVNPFGQPPAPPPYSNPFQPPPPPPVQNPFGNGR